MGQETQWEGVSMELARERPDVVCQRLEHEKGPGTSVPVFSILFAAFPGVLLAEGLSNSPAKQVAFAQGIEISRTDLCAAKRRKS